MEPPDGIRDDHQRPHSGLRRHASPASLLILAALMGLAFVGVYGREETNSVRTDAVALEVHAPARIRNGEFFEIRITVAPSRPVGELTIGIDESLLRDITVNTIIPAPTEEESAGGEFRFRFGEVAAGEAFRLKVDLQINPDVFGGTAGAVRVYDGEAALAELPIEIEVLP